jgi:hypothetical protein
MSTNDIDRMANDLADCDPRIQTGEQYEKMATWLVESCGWTRDDGAATRAQLASALRELTERFLPANNPRNDNRPTGKGRPMTPDQARDLEERIPVAAGFPDERMRQIITSRIRLYADRVVIDVTPAPKTTHDRGDFKYRVIADTDPDCTDDLDQPITLTDTDRKTAEEINLETDDAEALAWALIRAVQVRREFMADRQRASQEAKDDR